MAVEITDRVASGVEAAAEQGVMGADLLAGATVAAVETMSNPVRAIRRLERKGAPINTQLKRTATRQVNEAGEALQAYLPEQILLGGLRLVKERARRKDLVGEIAFRTLEIINDRLGAASTVVQRMERASAPPSRGSAKAPLATTVREVKTSTRRTAAKAASRTVSKTRGTARRATAAARRTERRPAPRRAS